MNYTRTYRISNDASLVYEIGNPEYRDTAHVFDVTSAGRVSGYVKTTPEYMATEDGRDMLARAIHRGEAAQ